MRSLQFRLSLGLFVSLALAFVVLWILVSSASRYLAEGYISTRLEHDTESLLTALQFDNTGKFTLDTNRLNPIYARPFSGHYFKIQAAHDSLRSRSLWDQDLSVPSLASGSQQHRYVRGPQHQPLLMLISAFDKSGQVVTIAVADDLSPVEKDLRHLQRYFVLAALILLLILIGVQGLILHAGLRPLDKTRQELQALTQGKLTQLDQDVPKEVLPLVAEINHLLDVLEKRLSRSRNALGDLAHALKKPLTVLKQLARADSLANDPDLQHTILQQLETLQRHITRILQRARLAGEGPVGSLFHATEEIPALLATLQQMYHTKSLVFESQLPKDLTIAVDREDMLELIGNLLDNACKWAAHRVRIRLTQNQTTHIDIEDDGPGVDAEKLSELTQRGRRLDETTEGHGLGLAIVHEIVTSVGGEIQLQRSQELGGLHARVILKPGTKA
jgi:signal transduction histidine kinase